MGGIGQRREVYEGGGQGECFSVGFSDMEGVG